MHPMPRSVARIVVIAAVTVSSGALVAVPPAMADIGTDMRFVCAGEAGTHEVGLRVETSVPAAGAVGEPVQPGTVKVSVDVPAELADEVLVKSPGEISAPPVTGVAASPTIAGVAQLQVTVQNAALKRSGGWPAFALAATSSRGDGTVHLTGSGVAPPAVPRLRGGLSWVAGALDLSLVPGDTANRTDEAGLSLRCTAEKETVLGTVRVQEGGQASALTGRSGVRPQAAPPQGGLCKEIPGPGVDPRYDFNDDPALKKLFEDPPRPDGLKQSPTKQGIPNCVKATGFVNINKAGSAVPVAIESLLRRNIIEYSAIDLAFGPNYFESTGYAVNNSYPASGTVLGFGFMPTRAVAKAVQVRAPGDKKDDPITGNFRLRIQNSTYRTPNVLKNRTLGVNSYTRLDVDKAAVNGVPIDLGDNCTTTPTLLKARGFLGSYETGFREAVNGQVIVVEGLEIPAFTGCGVTEDLSPLLTASVSGTGNYARAESGKWCDPVSGGDCVNNSGPPPMTVTVSPGGDVTGVAEPFVFQTLGPPARAGRVTCESATMRLHLDEGHWQSDFLLGKARMSFDSCTIKASTGTVYPADISQIDNLFVSITEFNEDGTALFSVNNMIIKAKTDLNGPNEPGGGCYLGFGGMYFGPNFNFVTGPGSITGPYDNGTGVMSAPPGGMVGADQGRLGISPESTCTIPGFFGGSLLGTGTADFKFPKPWPKFTTP